MLSLLSKIYGQIMNTRNRLYDNGVFDTFDLGAKTISVGNITTGGTGKTPLVAYIANLLAEQGETVCILTRGYGRREPKKRVLVSDGKEILVSAEDSGDEPFELATKLLGKAIVIADADRVSAGEFAKRSFGVTRFLLDDGFQHRRVRRDVDIVCVDAAGTFGNRAVLPKGNLREPLSNIRRADILVILKSHPTTDTVRLSSELRVLAPGTLIFIAEKTYASISQINGNLSEHDFDVGAPIFGFCGIGDPSSFMSTLKAKNFNMVGFRSFGDHFPYSQRELAKIEELAIKTGASALVTTKKDAVKIEKLALNVPCYFIEISVVFDEPEQFHQIL